VVERVVHNYYRFFDETLKSSTFIVLIITLLICSVGIIVPSHVGIDLSSASHENMIMID